MILKNVFKISKGKKAVESNDNNLQRYIQIGDLRSDDKIKYAEHDDKNIICNENDVLIAWDGANAGTIGYNLKGVIGSTLAKLSPKVDNIYSPYTGRFLQSQFRYLRETCTGATIPHISRPTLESLNIPLPPLDQQKKIAAILDAADAYRQKTKALIQKYDELTQSLFLDMFGDPVGNPKGWERIKLEEIGTISSGSTPSRKNEENFNGDIPWVKTGEVNSKIILDTEEKISKTALSNSSCKLYPAGSLIIAMYGQGKTRGQVGLLGIEASTNQACAVLTKSDKANFIFLYKLIQMSYIDLRSLGRGGNQPNLNSGILKKYLVINPPFVLQNQFEYIFQAIESQKAQAQASLAQAEDLFNSLLQRAFKGELTN